MKKSHARLAHGIIVIWKKYGACSIYLSNLRQKSCLVPINFTCQYLIYIFSLFNHEIHNALAFLLLHHVNGIILSH
jgi:hypothetical protein